MMDFYTKGLEITGAAHKAGVEVMVGTDNGDSYVFPGFAVDDELQELVKVDSLRQKRSRRLPGMGQSSLGEHRTTEASSRANWQT